MSRGAKVDVAVAIAVFDVAIDTLLCHCRNVLDHLSGIARQLSHQSRRHSDLVVSRATAIGDGVDGDPQRRVALHLAAKALDDLIVAVEVVQEGLEWLDALLGRQVSVKLLHLDAGVVDVLGYQPFYDLESVVELALCEPEGLSLSIQLGELVAEGVGG